ncbi:hypothetical protein Clacol_003060 [Clathrus columnatus]|uniref:Major facilitator superfamily (MFS) profile domain-containing protein n=1 Tax=Clathrus columnatus TaxID=1419009 RepID=A0AAV5A8F3_9AGAM|nr:hypothetical protein Clacol_003060 [Clathrus columnatus]
MGTPGSVKQCPTSQVDSVFDEGLEEVERGKEQSDDKDSFLVAFEVNDPENPKIVTPCPSELEPYEALDLYGRKPFFIVSFTVYTLCQVGSALAPNGAALLIFRFLGGCFAANPITNSGAFISDIWEARERGKAMAVFCVAPFVGPTLGPLVAGFIEISDVSFRWLYWVLACFFVYGCIYLLFEAYPIVFEQGHHMNAGSAGLMFLPILLGCITAGILYRTVFQPLYEADIEKYKPNNPPPEVRLKSAIYSGPLYVISFFWFGWTSYPFISYWASMSSGVFLGVSISLIFVALTNYIVDAYLSVAASALAVYTVIRSAAGAGFPLFARAMYNKLGPQWASTILGVVALLLVPIPLVLQRYGETLRKRSSYVPNL